jgi:molybdate/tungstate transport system ATP-binding protein
MISIRNLCVRAGEFSLRNVNLTIDQGRYAILMGKTGCGKTTLLESICGLRRATSGAITLLGRDVTRLKPAERGIGYVPQDRCLFQTMTVRDNIAFALQIRRMPRQRIGERVEELAELLGITHLLERYPHGLSGGESQRVALGRALSFRPGILCLDEPLSALDASTRQEMQELLLSIKNFSNVTILHITHDWEEAVKLADDMFIMRNGAVAAVGEASQGDTPTRDLAGVESLAPLACALEA